MWSTGSCTNVANFLLDGKETDRIALRLLNSEHSYGELRGSVSQVVAYLVQLGCTKGDRVVLVSDNSFFWAAAYLGILRAGLVCVPLSPSISIEDLKYVLEFTQVRLAMTQAGFAIKNGAHFEGIHLLTDGKIAVLPNVASQTSFGELGPDSERTHLAFDEVGSDDLAALMFTSGSTGKPRGVMVSHRNIMANTESIIQYLGLTEKDRILTVLPFHYCFGTSLLHTHLRVGASLVLDSRFMYSEAVLQRMLEAECTGFAGVPSHFQILLRSSSLRKKTFPCLRYVQQAGGHLAPTFIRELQAALPNTQIFVMYGQTEATARLSYLPPDCLDTKIGSIGKGIPGVKLSVLGESGDAVKPGEVGEIVAGGENVALGYWQAPHETASSFRNGRLYTGDMATVDEDGFIYVVYRAKDFVKCGGRRVACRQIEDKLLECEELLEAAVTGVPDEVLGEAVKAYVVPRANNTNRFKEVLLDFCKRHMPPQIVPRDIVVLQALPKNSAGKVLKHNLRAM
jgi:acyl-CoA synthetase (AMP-forming)/AMP-acid ligase II